jgi:hypothetical protein
MASAAYITYSLYHRCRSARFWVLVCKHLSHYSLQYMSRSGLEIFSTASSETAFRIASSWSKNLPSDFAVTKAVLPSTFRCSTGCIKGYFSLALARYLAHFLLAVCKSESGEPPDLKELVRLCCHSSYNNSLYVRSRLLTSPSVVPEFCLLLICCVSVS